MPKQHHPLGIGMTPSKTELGKFLRTRRFELGLRQAEVARLLNIGQSRYSALEIGKLKYIKSEDLRGFAEVLQCKLSQLQSLVSEKPEPKTELGRLIRTRRIQLGLTLKEFAEISGTTYSIIINLENGTRNNFSYRLINPLAKALGVEPSTLFNCVGSRMKATDSKLGQLIRARRKELEINQPQLAQKLKITKHFLSLIELGKYLPADNGIVMKRLAEVLKINLAELQEARLE